MDLWGLNLRESATLAAVQYWNGNGNGNGNGGSLGAWLAAVPKYY